MSSLQTPDDPSAPTHEPPVDVDIRIVRRADEMLEVAEVFRQVWGAVEDLVRLEMMMAISHAGGYISAAYDVSDGERILGASVGILADHRGRRALHSHITGLLPGARRRGVGRTMKLHQKRWAREHGIEWIVWTFDPLVRRNAWFNIAVLGAEVDEYLESFYGTMTDSINAGDDSDRLLVAWDVNRDVDDRLHDGSDVSNAELIATPDDIVTLRRTDLDAVRHWRMQTRETLGGAIAERRRVLGFTRAGEYVLEAR